ncbi:Fc.00g059390.m01.CDS01 [Cosmosporella sp. VM-42]
MRYNETLTEALVPARKFKDFGSQGYDPDTCCLDLRKDFFFFYITMVKPTKMKRTKDSIKNPNNCPSDLAIYPLSQDTKVEGTKDSTKDISQSETFHYFNMLPTELREMIWAFAMRDERPGIHVFTTTSMWVGQDPIDTENERKIFGSQVPPWGSPCQPPLYQFSIPRDVQRVTAASSVPNPSSYLIDSGLWTACRESCAVMEVIHGKRTRDCLTPRISDGRATENLGGRIGYFFDDEEHEQYFTVLPHDLVYFQSPDLAKTEFLSDLPFIKDQWRPNGVEHVALEFDPSWEVPGVEDFLKQSGKLSVQNTLVGAKLGLENLWFVDYRIRRSHSFLKTRYVLRENRHVFYGNGCQFAEVRPSDTEWCFMDGTPLYSEDIEWRAENVRQLARRDSTPNPFFFADRLASNSWSGRYEDDDLRISSDVSSSMPQEPSLYSQEFMEVE